MVTTKNEKTLQTTNRPVVDKKHEMSILQKIKERFGVHTYSEKGEKDMTKVVEFLQANPVQYLATVGRDGKAKCRPFMFCFEKMASYGSAQTIQKMYIKICLQIRKSKYLYPVRNMHGSVYMEQQYLKITKK